MPIIRGILGPHTFEDVPYHTHEYDELSGKLTVSEADITSLSASKITTGSIEATVITIGSGGVIKSSNFVTGPTGDGWQLSPTLAEFNNVTVRGTLIAGSGSSVDWTYLTNISVTNADIVDLNAEKINAGTLDSGVINTGALNADNITTGTLSADFISGGTISADLISGGTLSGDLIFGGTINATNVNVTNINGTNITTNTIPGDAMNVSSLSAIDGNTGSITVNGWLTTTTGGGFRTGSSGARVEIDDNSPEFVRLYNTSGTQVGKVGYDTGFSAMTVQAVGELVLYGSNGLSAWGGTNNQISFGGTTGGYTDLLTGTSYSIRFFSGSTQKMYVDSNGLTVSDDLRISSGTAGAPSLSFSADTNTGIYRVGENQLGFAAGGEPVMYMSTDYLTNADASDRPAIRFDGASAQGTPAYAFYGDTDTGMYRYSSDVIGFSAGATWRLLVATTEIIPNVPLRMNTSGSVSAPAFSYNTDNNTGFYRTAADYHAATAGGVIVQQWGYTGSVKEIYFYGLQASDQNDVQYHGTTGLLSYVSSTLKIKKDIRPLEVGLTDRLRPSRFKYRRNDEITAKHMSVAEDSWDTEQVGFIAEWTADEIPEAGIRNDEYKRPVNYKHRAVLAATVADLQDARKRIAELEERLEKVEALLAAA